MNRLSLLSAAYCLLFSSGTVSSQQAEKLLLVERLAAGDVSISREHMDIDFAMKMTITGSPDKDLKYAASGVREYRSQVDAVDQSGAPTNIVRYYTAARDTETSDEGVKKKPLSLEGKNVRIKRTPTGADVTASSGTVADKDKHDVASSVKRDPARLFPNHPIAIGESWTPDLGMLDASSDMKVRSASAKLIEITQFEGHRCAHIHLSAEMEQHPEKALTMSLKMEGDAYQALDIQRLLALQMSGPITISGKESDSGINIEATGTGTMKLVMNDEWVQVAGKPVTVQSSPKL